MSCSILNHHLSEVVRAVRLIVLVLIVLVAARYGEAQDTPLLSGGVGFLTSTNSGSTTYMPIIEPLLAAPIGQHFLVESRAALLESFAPKGGDQSGYDHTHFIGLTYLQGDYIASPHVTSRRWHLPASIWDLQRAPLAYLDRQLPGRSAHRESRPYVHWEWVREAMLRGSAISRRKYSIDYRAYFSSSQTLNSSPPSDPPEVAPASTCPSSA